MKVLTINNKTDEKFLRRKTHNFDFSKADKIEIREMIKNMRVAIKENKGVGLSANQIGSEWRLFIAEVPSDEGKPKFYAVFNPEIIKASKEKTILEEGCLSVPGAWGLVERPEQIIITGLDKNGKKIKIKAWGLQARIFQHETDHLNGILFIDRTKKVYKAETNDKADERL